MEIRIGTRTSQLALWQAEWTAQALRKEGFSVKIFPITTAGDNIKLGPVSPMISAEGTNVGVFTKELQQALLNKEIDVAVHSLKDLPTDTVPGLSLTATLPRASVMDVLVVRKDYPRPVTSLSNLRSGAVIGTSSLRRRAQLLAFRKDFIVRGIRGNLNRRIEKLDTGEYDALILAQAGIERLGWGHRISAIIPTEIMMPAVGQGALGLETRSDDTVTNKALARINDPLTFACVTAERAMLKALDGGCATPVGAISFVVKKVTHGTRKAPFLFLHLSGRVITVDGRASLEKTLSGTDPTLLGVSVAANLLEMGAKDYITEARAFR